MRDIHVAWWKYELMFLHLMYNLKLIKFEYVESLNQ